MLFELRDVGLTRGGRAGPRLGQRRDPGRRDRDRRALGQRQVDPAAAAQPARRPRPRRRSPTAAGRCAEYDPLELRREVSLVPQLPALLEGTVESNLALRRRPRRPASSTRRAACASPASTPASPSATSPSSRSASSSGRCWPGRWRSEPDGAAARRADLGARPRGPRRDRGDAGRAARASSRSRSSWSPTTPSRRGGWATGWCGSRPAGSVGCGAARARCWRDVAAPRSTSRSGRSPPRWRWSRWRSAISLLAPAPTSSATSASPRCARSSS